MRPVDSDRYLSALLARASDATRQAGPGESEWSTVTTEAWAMGRATGSIEVLLALGLLDQGAARSWHERFSREIYGSRRS